MRLSKSIKFILKKISIRVFYSLMLVCFIGGLIKPIICLSILLGTIFSGFIFLTFTYSQYFILVKQNKSNFFVLFFLRLIFYVVSLSIGLAFEKYFNFFIILISLFHYQIHYISFEFFRSLAKYKRKKSNGWIS
jgi:hypothetical protein